MLPLGLLSVGEEAEIVGIMGGEQGRGLRESRMEMMGIRVGKSVRVLNGGRENLLLVKVDGSKIAMSRGMAMGVLVRKVAT